MLSAVLMVRVTTAIIALHLSHIVYRRRFITGSVSHRGKLRFTSRRRVTRPSAMVMSFCRRTSSLMDRADPEGVDRDRSAPPGPPVFRGTVTVGFTHGYSWNSPAGSTERPNVFGSHSSKQWLILMSADPPVPVPAGSATLATFLSQGRPLR